MHQPNFLILHEGGLRLRHTGRARYADRRETPRSGLVGSIDGATGAVPIDPGRRKFEGVVFTGAERPCPSCDNRPLPKHACEPRHYGLRSPTLAAQAAARLVRAGIEASVDPAGGTDPSAVVPLEVALSDEGVPAVKISGGRTSGPSLDVAAGWAPSRRGDAGPPILASGKRLHSTSGHRDPHAAAPSAASDVRPTETAMQSFKGEHQ